MRDRIWTYGRFDGETPELAVERALREVDTGLTALKGDPFGHQGLFITPEAERDAIAKVKAVREAVGDDVELLVEVHGRLAPAAAIRIGNALEEFRPFVFEEPVPPQNVGAMAKVAEAVNIPLATGERLYTKWGFVELLEKQVVAMIQPDVCHAGRDLRAEENCRDGGGILRRHSTPQPLRSYQHDGGAASRCVYAELHDPRGWSRPLV